MKMQRTVKVLSAALATTILAGTASAADLLDVAVAGSNDHVYYWYSDGQVTSGTTRNPSRYRTAYSANGLVGMSLMAVGIAGSNDHVYYWWRAPDGSMSVTSGTTDNPMRYVEEPYDFFGLGGQTLIAAGIAGSNDHVYYWWSDNQTGQITVSSGTSAAPQAYLNRRSFHGAPMAQFNELIAAGIAGSNDHVYYWWRNRATGEITVTSGTSTNPLAYISEPYDANLALF